MTLTWDERKRLVRVAGLAEELLSVAQATGLETARPSLESHIDFLVREVHAILGASDSTAAQDFERLVVRGPEEHVPAELHAAAFLGWLKAELAVENVDEKREEEAASRPQPRQKHTIGFKIRSPITREHSIPQQSATPTPEQPRPPTS